MPAQWKDLIISALTGAPLAFLMWWGLWRWRRPLLQKLREGRSFRRDFLRAHAWSAGLCAAGALVLIGYSVSLFGWAEFAARSQQRIGQFFGGFLAVWLVVAATVGYVLISPHIDRSAGRS